jgi:hypothetical protein
MISSFDWEIPSISTQRTIQEQLLKSFSKCSSDFYIIAQQQGVNAGDYTSRSTPHLQEWMERRSNDVKFSATVSEVLGELKSTDLEEILQKGCGGDTMIIDPSGIVVLLKKQVARLTLIAGYVDITSNGKPKTIIVNFPAPGTGKKRADALRTNGKPFHVLLKKSINSSIDLYLSNLVHSLTSSYTVLYTTTPGSDAKQATETVTYEMDSSNLVHMDMKRDIGIESRAESNNITLVDGPLFERYQYFTPGK